MLINCLLGWELVCFAGCTTTIITITIHSHFWHFPPHCRHVLTRHTPSHLLTPPTAFTEGCLCHATGSWPHSRQETSVGCVCEEGVPGTGQLWLDHVHWVAQTSSLRREGVAMATINVFASLSCDRVCTECSSWLSRYREWRAVSMLEYILVKSPEIIQSEKRVDNEKKIRLLVACLCRATVHA